MTRMPIPLSPTERRERVALPANHAKSNRVLGTELDAHESTIRRDRKFLRTPKHQRPINKRRPKKIKLLTPEQRLKQMLKVSKQWVADQAMERAYVLWIIPEADKRLFKARELISTFPEPSLSPAELLVAMRPSEPKEHFTSDMLEFWANWLVRWLAHCAPRDEKLWEEVLCKTQRWAEVSLPYW
jgi:hypothetical protein